jgi:CheY-like chemotaxis protein
MPDVLIVEDDDDIRESLAELLRDEGFTITVACHGRAALEAIAQAVPRLILLDLMMPVMNGWELLKELARCPKRSGIPVIIVSATASDVPAGAVAVLRKPVDVQHLLDTLRNQLGRLAAG